MKKLICSNRLGSRLRRGSALYITVVGVALIVSLMGALALVTARLELRRVGQSQDAQHARRLAQSALEFGLANIDFDANWRTTFTNDIESSPLDWQGISSEAGTMTFKVVDESDSDLADDPSDMARLYGIGRVGEAKYVTSVLLEPTGAGLSCLEASIHTDGEFWLPNGVTVTTNQFVSTNFEIFNSGSGIVNGDGEAVVWVKPGSVTGTATDGITPRQMPDSTLAFEYYLNNGTWIDFNDVPSAVIDQQVLSPGNNPFGDNATNPQGIYVIDCDGSDFEIRDSRLVATLILLNPGSGTLITQQIHWEPAVQNFPALMIDGDLSLEMDGGVPLSEIDQSTNFNPPHTPYQEQSDGDQSDSYPGVIKGLVYVAGQFAIDNPSVVDGVIVTETIMPMKDLTLTYDPVFLNNPPPGFRAAGLGSGSNLLSNPGFESGTTNWSASTCNIVIDPGGDYRTGSQCLSVFGLSLPTSGPVQLITGSLQNGATYDAEVWVKMTSGSANIEIEIETNGSSGTQRFTNGTTNVGSTWTKVATNLTPTWSGTLASAFLKVHNKTDFTAFKIDDAVLQQQGAATQTKMQISPGSWRREPGN